MDLKVSGSDEIFENMKALKAFLKYRRCENCQHWEPYRRSQRRWVWGFCSAEVHPRCKWTGGEGCELFGKRSGPLVIHGGKSRRTMQYLRKYSFDRL